MQPDDPRHGTEAGYEQHRRDGEKPCDPCHEGDLIAARRRRKRQQLGQVSALPIGEANHAKLAKLHERGASTRQMGEWAGTNSSVIWHILNEGPTRRVWVRTYIAIRDMQPGALVTPLGVRRRLQALAAMGWGVNRIAAEIDVHQDTLSDIRVGNVNQVHDATTEAVVDFYQRHHLTPLKPTERYERAAATNSRNHARRMGWAPPAAWDNIDDPNEEPKGHVVCKVADCVGEVTALGMCSAHYKQVRGLKRDPQEVDESAVIRALNGDFKAANDRATRAEVVRQWVEKGRSVGDLERLSGWKPERYWKKEAAA